MIRNIIRNITKNIIKNNHNNHNNNTQLFRAKKKEKQRDDLLYLFYLLYDYISFNLKIETFTLSLYNRFYFFSLFLLYTENIEILTTV